MSKEVLVEQAEIILVSGNSSVANQQECGPDYPDGPCQPMQLPCNPECNPACMPSSIPCNPDIPCYPDIGRPPEPPYPGPG